MALDYTKAPLVKIGDKIRSSQWNQLAQAFNDRFLGGVGDPTYRLHWYLHSIFRAFRKNSGFLFAAEDEWWKFYSHIKPLTSDYPNAAAGDPEGINKNNPMGNFVFGNDANDTESEPDRLNYSGATGEGIVLHDALGAPVSDVDHWEIGKYQRGVTDSTGTDLDQANALIAAQHHKKLRGAGFLHKGYGGFLPSPAINGYCIENDEDVDGRLDINLKFTVLADESTCTYSTCNGGSGTGSCPGVSKSVVFWGQTTDAYILLHDDGTTTTLPFDDYLEGPYNGSNDDARLNRLDGAQLERAVNFYSNNFRGSASEREESDYAVQNHAFEFETFFKRQYYLAPSYGVPSGYGDGSHNAVYPQYDWTTGVQAGYGLTGGVDYHDIHDGFVCAGFIAVGENLTGPKTFTLEIDGKIQGSVTIDPTTDNKSLWFKTPIKGRVRIRSSKEMTGSEEAYCEIAEILEMKPQNEDVYLVLRMGSANNTGDDGDGQDTSTPRDISDDYFRHGMIYNGTRDATRTETTHINRNPVYENMRRVSHDRTRMIDRVEIKGYEVSGGKSILYFDRLARGVSDADMWDGIAPPTAAVSSGEIKHNVKYIVDSGTTGITYNGESVAVGSTFTGVKGVHDFTKTNGDEVVKQYDGIIATAGEQSTDNNWSMFLTTIGYQPADGATYKPDAYSDVVGWGHDRCATFSGEWTANTAIGKEINRHVTPGGSKILQRSESPSGYRYVLGTHTPSPASGPSNLVTQQNDAACSSDITEANCQGIVDHYSSCQVYVPDYKIESVTVTATGEIKVTLEGRLRRNDSAPSNVTNSTAGWDSYLSSESGPRSDENAIVEYLRWSAGSGTNCLQRIGDWAPDAAASMSSKIKGSCMPRFYFTRQIPKVFEDSPPNQILETHDTRMVTDEIIWMDLVLRAICEGYIDEESTNDNRDIYTDPITFLPRCRYKRLFDYTYENLLLQSNGNRWQRVVPLSERSDNPKMFGPFPDVITYAEHFNQISNAINKLYRARLYLPIQVKYRNIDYEGAWPVSVEGDGNCFSGAVWLEDRQPPEAPTLRTDISPNPGNWQTDDGTSGDITLLASQRSYIKEISSQCHVYTERNDVEYHFELMDLAYKALPSDLYNLVVNDKSTGFLCTMDIVDTIHTRSITVPGDGHTGNGTEESYHDDAGNPQRWDPTTTRTTTCIIANSGTLKSPRPSTSDFVDPHDGTAAALGAETERILLVEDIEAFVSVPLV